MKISSRLLILLALLPVPAMALGGLTPKVGLRTAVGLLKNKGTQGGLASGIGAFNALGSLYPTADFALYVGYAFQFDVKSGSLPLKGLFGGVRYHFLGEGTRVTRDQSSISSTTRSRWSLYGALEFAQRAYFTTTLDSNGNSVNVDGSSLAFNCALGAELRLTNHLDLNAELNNTLLTFAASDPRFRISGFLVHLGIGFLF